MAKNIALDLLFFRHAIERKRADGYFAYKLLKPPFESRGSGSSGSWEDADWIEPAWRAPQPLALIVGRFPKQIWMSLQFVGGDLEQVLDANRNASRLEFLRLNRKAGRQLPSIEIIKKGSTRLKLDSTGDDSWLLSGPDKLPEWDALTTFAEVTTAIRKQYQFESLLRVLTTSETSSDYAVINEKGRSLKPRVSTEAHIEGPPPIDNLQASVSLAEAIESGNPEDVRELIEAGVSLLHVPNSSMSPLQLALYRIERPGGIECAQALVDGGASLEGLLPHCLSGYQADAWRTEAARFLIDCGADVNELDDYKGSAIWGAVCQVNLPAIRLLIDCGADPHTPISKMNQTVIEWVETKLAEATKQSKQKQYAEILSLLTGELVLPPETPKLPGVYRTENERFRLALQARQLLAQLPDHVNVTVPLDDELRSPKRFEQLGAALESLGFQRQGQYVDDFGAPKTIVVYVDPVKRLDAVLQDCWWLNLVACQVTAYGDDGHIFACSDTNLKSPDEPSLSCLTTFEFPGVEPIELVQQLEAVIEERKVGRLENPADQFVQRYTAAYDRMLAETKLELQNRLQEVPRHANGEHPLYERRGIYLDFSSWDDPSRCSETMMQELLEEVSEVNQAKCFSVSMAIGDAFSLLAMQRLQYAGAPADNAFLDRGCELAVHLFENLKTKWKKDLTFQMIDELWMSLLMCQISTARGQNRQPEFAKICNLVQPKMANRELRDSGDLPLALGQWTMLFVSRFRERAVAKLDQWRGRVSDSVDKRAKYLLGAMDAADADDEDAFLQHLSSSIEQFRSTLADTRPNQLSRHFALPESLLWNAMIEKGCEYNLDQSLADELMIER